MSDPAVGVPRASQSGSRSVKPPATWGWRRAPFASGPTPAACAPSTRPAATAATDATTSTRSSRAPARAPSEGPLVLIVDDDEQVREYVRVNLEAEGYDVREAGNAEEGLRAVEEARPDLVLLDVMMPQVDGWEMLRQLQERHGEAVPVVMFSGKADAATADEIAERGAQGFIGKPFDPGQLIEKTKQLLSS